MIKSEHDYRGVRVKIKQTNENTINFYVTDKYGGHTIRFIRINGAWQQRGGEKFLAHSRESRKINLPDHIKSLLPRKKPVQN